MEGSAIAPPKTVTRQGYLIVTLLLGIAGSLVALYGFGKGTYRVGPLLVEMSVRPDTSGTTELGVRFAQLGLKAGSVETKTHEGLLAIRGTVVDLVGGESVAPDAILATKDPASLARTIRDQGKDAFRKFAIRLGLVTVAGGAAGGFAIALVGLKTRRLFQGALAGVIVVGALGLLAWQTYDIDKLNGVQFKPPSALQILNR